jgi:hypothetical protein
MVRSRGTDPRQAAAGGGLVGTGFTVGDVPTPLARDCSLPRAAGPSVTSGGFRSRDWRRAEPAPDPAIGLDPATAATSGHVDIVYYSYPNADCDVATCTFRPDP